MINAADVGGEEDEDEDEEYFEPRDLYRKIEDWWGDSLSLKLVDRISQSPPKHLSSFFDTLPPLSSGLNATPSGRLRPAISSSVRDFTIADPVRRGYRLRVDFYFTHMRSFSDTRTFRL